MCEDFRDLVEFFPCQTNEDVLPGKEGTEGQHADPCEGKTCSLPAMKISCGFG